MATDPFADLKFSPIDSENTDTQVGKTADPYAGLKFSSVFPEDNTAPEESSNPLVNLGVGLAKGTVYGLPKMVAQSAQFLGVGGETAKKVAEWGDEGLGNQEKGAFRQAGEMIPASIGIPVAAHVVGSALQAIPSPYTQAAGLAIKIAGKYATPAMFGLSQAQETRNTAEKAGVPEGAAPYITGGIEWAGETAGNVALGRLFGPLATVGKAAKEAIKKMSATTVLKGSIASYLKELALVTAPTEILTEMGQNYGEAMVEKGYGIRPEAEPGQEAISAIAPTAIMTAILGPFGRIAQTHVANKQATLLSQPIPEGTDSAPQLAQLRFKIAERMAEVIPDEGLRAQWLQYADQKIKKNLPIDIASPLDSLSMSIDSQIDEMSPEDRKAIEPPTFADVDMEDKGPLGRSAGTIVPPVPTFEEGVGSAVEGAGQGGEGVGPGYGAGGTVQPEQAPPEQQPLRSGELRRQDQKNYWIREQWEKATARKLSEKKPFDNVTIWNELSDQWDKEHPTKEDIDAKAGEAAKPTEAQAEAGNYKKGHVNFQGLDISIENPSGSARKGVDETGRPWEMKLAHHYGYIRKTEGKDGDHVDVFVGPNPESQKVYIVDQRNLKTGKFDEHKTLVGFGSLEEARAGYLANYDQKGPERIMGITEMPIDQFKDWIKGDTTKRVSKEEVVPPTPPEPPSTEPGKRSWYDFKDLPFDQLTDEEIDRLDVGPTPEETAGYNTRKNAQETEASAAQEEETRRTTEGKTRQAEIMRRAQDTWARKYPALSVGEVANTVRIIADARGKHAILKASEFYNEVTRRLNIPMEYDFLATILDRMGVPIELTDASSVDPGIQSDGAFIHPHAGGPGRIVIAHRAMAGSVDYGKGYGTAHLIETFIHEGIHAVVRNAPNWRQSEAKLKAFRDTLLQHEASAPDVVRMYLKHMDKYDVDELIAEAFSDIKFAQWLDSIPAEGVKNQSKTLWGKLKDIIFRALETFGIPKTKLDELNEILDQTLSLEPTEPTKPPAEPAVPTHAKYGPLNKMDTVALSALFEEKIKTYKGKMDKGTVKTWIQNEYGITTGELNDAEREGRYDHKAVEEAFEYAIIKTAREYIDKYEKSPDGLLRVFQGVYENQPNLASRTSESTTLQQYSTPLPLAWLMNKFLGMTGRNSFASVYEPTAGNGMLLIGANPASSDVWANELDKGNRLNNLHDFLPEGIVTGLDALSPGSAPLPRTRDRVIMNPPFGLADRERNFDGYILKKLEHQIVAQALTVMKDNGKAAFIIGGHNAGVSGRETMTMNDRIFFNWLYNNFNVTHNIDVNGDLYARQGTKFPIRLVTIEGRRAEPLAGIPNYTGIEDAETFQEVSDILEREVPNADIQTEGATAEGQTPIEEAEPGGEPSGGIPPGPGAGGQGIRDTGVPGEPGGGVRAGGGERPGGPAGPATGEREPEGGRGGEAGPVEPGNLPEQPGGPAQGVATEGEGGRVPGESGVTNVDQAIDELGSIEVPQFMPYEKAEEETFYQDKMKPAIEKVVTGVFDDAGLDATNADIMTRVKDRLKEKYESVKKYVFRFLREEFESLKQMIRDSALFQTKYKPRSGGPIGNTLVPRNQEQAIQRALDAIEQEHGNIDDWVMNELQYADHAALHKAFAAEQVDALAMAMQNIKENAGMIIGDQTGVGKGRVVAGIIRWANLKDLTPIFVTDKANLFSDMYRDLLAIDHKIKPFIMNNDRADILDQETGAIIMNAKADGKGKEAIVQRIDREGNKSWGVDWNKILADPKAYLARHDMKAIFTTYSQHNVDGMKNQDMLLHRMGANNIFILDESHNAAGSSTGDNSNTKLKFMEFLAHADAVLYSSATFAKTPHNMALYFRTSLGDTGMKMFELIDAIGRGGNPLQEYISNALAEKGQYLRRELDFSGIDFFSNATMENTNESDPRYPDLKAQYERDKRIADKSNDVVRKIIDFSNDLHHRGNSGRLASLLAAKGVMLGGTGNQRMSLSSTTFASVVHNFSAQLLTAIKVQRTIDEAKTALADGKKVVINLMNTMGSFIEDMIDKDQASVGEEIDFTYKSVLQRAVDNTLRLTVRSGQGQKTYIRITPDELRTYLPSTYQEYLKTKSALDAYDGADLHASPIDFLTSELKKISSKPVVEITGRKYTIDYDDKSGQPTLQRRTKEDLDRQRSIRLFNRGDSDIIIINRAGSVGISLHASETFKDQKPRRMLLLQPDLDINIFMQALGRIFRKGQVTNPDYRYITSDLPAEIRPAVILRRKMASLKANTTSKQEGAETRKEVPDMMNKYGDRVARDYLNRNKQIAIQLRLIHSQRDSIPAELTYGKISGKMSVLPVELQKDFFGEVEEDYNSLIDELTAKGENDLISKNYDYRAKTITKNILHGGLDPNNPFTGSTYAEQMTVRQLKKPHNTAKLKELIKAALGGKPAQAFADNLQMESKNMLDRYWKQWTSTLEERYPGEPERQEHAQQERRQQLSAELETYKTLANYFKIGQTYDVPLGAGSQENLTGVLTNIIWKPGNTGNPVQLSKLKFVFSVADPIQTMVFNASQSWFREEAYVKGREIPADWDARTPPNKTEQKVIMTGNMLRAFNIVSILSPPIGFEMVNFTREDGNKEFGLVISRKDEDRVIGLNEGNLGKEVDMHDAFLYLSDPMVETERMISAKNGELNIESVIVTPVDKNDPASRPVMEYVVNVPSSARHGEKYYQNEKLREWIRNKNFRKNGQRMVANIGNTGALMGFMKVLKDQFNMNFILPQDQIQPMPFQEALTEADYERQAGELGITFNGMQERSNKPALPVFTDRLTGTTFMVSPGESTKEALARKRAQFESIQPMPYVKALTDKFLGTPQDIPDADIKRMKDHLKTQNDFRFQDKYFGLPWWNAKRYPAWRRAFEIFGIERPESRGQHMHAFVQIAEPFLAMDKAMRKAGKGRKEIQDARERISRVIITGDALLGPQLKALKRQVKTMKMGPERDRIEARIHQIETENRYSDAQLLDGIRDDQGNVVKLNQGEVDIYKSVRKSLDTLFDTYHDHLNAQAFRSYRKQKWYAILAQAAGMDLTKDQTIRVVGAGLNNAALLRAQKIQPDIQNIFERVESRIMETPNAEKMEAGELYGKIAEKLSEEIARLRNAIGELTGITNEKDLSSMTKAILSAYMMTRPYLKKIKNLRNTYKKQVAFFPRVREQGAQKLKLMRDVFDKEGLLVKQHQVYMEMFDNATEGAKIVEKIKTRYGKDGILPEGYHIVPERSTKTPEFAFQGVSDINMQKVLDDAIDGMKIRDSFYDAQGKRIDIHESLRNMGYQALAKQFQSRGFGQHGIHRQWNVIKGYKEEELPSVLFNYMTGMAGIMTKQTAAADFLEHMKEVKEPKMFESLAKYGRDQLRNETVADRFSNKARAFMFTWYLGGVLRPAVVQLTQNFVTGIPEHAKYLRANNLGGAGKADKDYMKAMADVALSNMTPLEQQLQRQLLTEGITTDQYIREIFGGLGSRFSQERLRILHWLAIPFSRMEQYNRQSAALTRFRPAYQLALKEGLSEEDAYDKAFASARTFVYDTHYPMMKANLPQIAQGPGIGVALKTLYTFKSFTHHFVLWNKNNLTDGDWKTFMHSMAYLALFGGLMGLPFLKDIFEWVEKEFGYSFTNSIRKTLNSAGGKTLETFGMHGIPAMLGTNMSGSLAIGVPFMGEDTLATIGGVYEGQLQKLTRAGEALGRGDMYRAAANVAPEFLRGPIVAAEESGIGKELFGTPGYTSTTRGRAVYGKAGKPLSLGPGEAIAKAAGFSPTANAEEKELSQTVRRQEAWAAEKKTDAAEAYRIARVQKDPDAMKNLMRDVREINMGIKSRGLQKLVPPAVLSKMIQSSRQIKGTKERRQEAYKGGV